MPRNTRNNQYPDAAPPAKRQTRSTSSSLMTRGRSAPGIDIGKNVATTPTKQNNVSTNEVSGKVDDSNDQPKFTIASILKDHDKRISKEEKIASGLAVLPDKEDDDDDDDDTAIPVAIIVNESAEK